MRLSDVDGMADRTLTISSAGKVFNLTGWRIGWMTGPEDLISGCRAICGYTTFSAPTPLQEGAYQLYRTARPYECILTRALSVFLTHTCAHADMYIISIYKTPPILLGEGG